MGSLLTKWSNSLNHYSKTKWTTLDLARLVVYAKYDVSPVKHDLKWLRAKTTLLPPVFFPEVTEKRLLTLTPVLEKPPLRELTAEELQVFQQILKKRFTDDDFKSVFKPRSKQDLAIRRTRAPAIARLIPDLVWAEWLPRLINLDYISVLNLLLAEVIHKDWLSVWHKANALNSLDDFVNTAKIWSNTLKKQPATHLTRQRFLEAAGLTGYRNPPFGDFDFMGESKRLAHGGEKHGVIGTDWLATFRKHAVLVQKGARPKPIDFISLRDFIASDIAATAGASSTGKVWWTDSEGEHKFKARKNFLMDIYSVDELYDQLLANLGRQSNKSFIKAELGKMRIAVTGDVWTYYCMAWLNYLCAGVYLDWDGNTLDETLEQQAARQEKIRGELKGSHCLPFDYAEFDHQASMDEVMILCDLFLSLGERNVPEEHKQLWLRVKNATVESFQHSVLIASLNNETQKFEVTGGVESGIRLTSTLGNYWNMVMTSVSREMIQQVGIRDDIYAYLRGDDSLIITNSYWTTLLFRLCYAANNAEGNDAKYGIHYEEGEFLRVWYAPGGNYGYANRAIPGLLQHKAWSSEPWAPESAVESQLETVSILERRYRRDFKWLKSWIENDWARASKQDIRWLQTPTTAGGLGLTSFRGWLPNNVWPKIDKVTGVKFRVDETSHELYQQKYEQWAITTDQAKELQQKAMIAKVATDDIPGMMVKFREQFRNELKTLRDTSWRIVVTRALDIQTLWDSCATLSRCSSVADYTRLLDIEVELFGRYKNMERLWTQAQEVSSVSDLKPMDWLRGYNVAMYRDIHKVELKGRMHRADAIDFLFGKIACFVGNLNPLVSNVISKHTARSVSYMMTAPSRFSRETWVLMTSLGSAKLSEAFATSTFYKAYYLY